MRTSTKIYLVLFIITTVVSGVLSSYVFKGILIRGTSLSFNFDAWGIVGIVFSVLSFIFGNILYFKFLKSLSLSKALFFTTVPLTVTFAVATYFIATLNSYNTPLTGLVRSVLKVSQNNYNNILWAVLFLVIYLLILFFTFSYICKPLRRIEMATVRLGDGNVKDEIIIGGNKQFRDIEYALNKINLNYKEKEKLIKKTNLESQKFIPKQFLKFLGKNSIAELELGNQVQREVTTMFCDIKSSTLMSKTLSLEENFNFINSYLNVVSPIIRRYNGFVDKYLGDGILAVFTDAEASIECANAIVKAINLKNNIQKDLPNVDARISIHTGEVIFGIVGEEERKSPTIISDAVNLASKMEDVNKFLGTKVIFSKRTLNSLRTNYGIAYRFIGQLILEDKSEMSIFEYLDCYEKNKREKLIDTRVRFEQGVRYYNEGKFEKAKDIFGGLLKDIREDTATYVYYNKSCEKLAV